MQKFFSVQNTPNTVSSSRDTKNRSFGGLVAQSGKGLADFEWNLLQDVREELKNHIMDFTIPSGFLKTPAKKRSAEDFTFLDPTDINFTPNSFLMRKKTAVVGGFPIVIEYTNTNTDGMNLIQLDTPPPIGDVRRSDFVFLEVWPALVGTSPKATGTLEVADYSVILVGDTITLGAFTLTAVAGVPSVDEFQIGGNNLATASNIANAINDSGNSFSTFVSATFNGTSTLYLRAVSGGSAGNTISLATSNALAFTVSGATLSGGADRPNKPSQEKLYVHGNVQSSSTVGVIDDLMDSVYSGELSQRIQIQYRIRTTSTAEAVNFKTNPNGFQSTVLAQGGESSPQATYPFVPADGVTVSSNSSALNYNKIDSGLWVAGDGSQTAAQDLQSLTGYVYAIPICFVFRRNDAYIGGAGSGFSPTLNTNGALPYNHPGFINPIIGVIPAGESDRPDSLFNDAINSLDMLDLRRFVSPSGHDFKSELDYQIKSLLDGNFKTWAIEIADKQTLGGGSGCVSTQPLVCNEIGRDSGNGGNNVTSGTTTRGVTIRNFDHISRRFGSQPVVERVVYDFYPQDRSVGPVTAPGRINPGKYVIKSSNPLASTNLGWFEGDEIHIDFTNLNACTDGFYNLPGSYTGTVYDFAPPGMTISDVLFVEHDDGNFTVNKPREVKIKSITGLGTQHIIITLDTVSTFQEFTGGLPGSPYPAIGASADDGSPRRIFVELEVSYPKGSGLTDTPDLLLDPEASVYPSGPVVENDISQRPSDMELLLSPKFREGVREVCLDYVASENGGGAPIGSLTTETLVSWTTNSLRFARRIYGSMSHVVGVTDLNTSLSRSVFNANTNFGSSERVLQLSQTVSGAQTLCSVTYYAQDPIPNYGSAGGGYQLSVYYKTNAPQTAGSIGGTVYEPSGLLPTTLELEPLHVSSNMWSGQVGAGSLDKGYPYLNPLDQIPINKSNTFEWSLSASTEISLSDFDADTGLLNLHGLVAADGTTDYSFGDLSNLPSIDSEFRTFYGFSDDTQYRPTMMAQALLHASTHKSFFGVLAKVKEDNKIFRKDEVVLIIISNYGEVTNKNTVAFTDTNNRTCAAIYRTKNILLLPNDE